MIMSITRIIHMKKMIQGRQAQEQAQAQEQ